MAKKSFIKVISIIEYLALIVATVAVLVSQFIPKLFIVIIGLSGYVIGFLFSSIRSVFACIEIFSASRKVDGEESALVVTNSVEVLNSKKERASSVVSAIIWLAIFAFSLVVLIWYVNKYALV